MKNDDQALNEVADENSVATSPVDEIKAEGEVEVPDADNASTEAQPEQSTETGESKKGFSNRVRELVKERNEARNEVKSLQQRMAELTRPEEELKMPEYKSEPIVNPGEEIDANELNRRIAERDQKILRNVDAIAQLRTKQSEAIMRINRESEEVMGLYPQLNPESEDFDQELSESITEATEAYVSKNPYSASPKSFVAKLMKPYTRAVSKEVGKVSESLAKQASETALRPTSLRKAEKPASEMTTAELEAKLGIVQA